MGTRPSAPTQLFVPKTQEGAVGKMEKLRRHLIQAGEALLITSLRRLLLVTVSETLQEILNMKHGYGH